MDELPSNSMPESRIPGLSARAKHSGWIRWLPGLNTLRQYQPTWFPQRSRCWPRHDDDACAGRHRVRRGLGHTRNQRSICHELRHCWRTPCSARAAFWSWGQTRRSRNPPKRRCAAFGRRSTTRGSARGNDGRRFRCCVHCGRGGAFGFITELLSKPIRYGYMNGIALTVLLSQLPKLFGFSVKADGPLRQAWGILDNVFAGNCKRCGLRGRRKHTCPDPVS